MFKQNSQSLIVKEIQNNITLCSVAGSPMCFGEQKEKRLADKHHLLANETPGY